MELANRISMHHSQRSRTLSTPERDKGTKGESGLGGMLAHVLHGLRYSVASCVSLPQEQGRTCWGQQAQYREG